METVSQGRLYRLAKRLSLGRLLRYGAYGPATASAAAKARSSPAKPYGTLGWPMRPGDWLPELEPLDPAFENYYPQNYEAAEGGMFVGLKPLGDLAAKTDRAAAALRQARRAELEGGGAHAPSQLALIVAPDGLRFVGPGTILAGKRNVRRILLLNGADDVTLVTGRLDMFVTEPRGTPVRGESVRLGECAGSRSCLPTGPAYMPSDSSLRSIPVRGLRRGAC